MEQDFFEGVKSEVVAARYYDWMMMTASFPAPMARVQELLPSDKLKPVQVVPGTARITLAAMEYRHIDVLSPYNEFGIFIPVVYEKPGTVSDLPGHYVWQLPVTTQEACDGGVTWYGFPKFVAQIDFDHLGEDLRCRVQAEGQEIITLEVKQVPTSPKSWEWYTYTVKDNHLLRTLVQIQGQLGATGMREGAFCTLGDHPIAEKLRALDMDRASVEHQYAPQLQSILYAPAAGERLSL